MDIYRTIQLTENQMTNLMIVLEDYDHDYNNKEGFKFCSEIAYDMLKIRLELKDELNEIDHKDFMESFKEKNADLYKEEEETNKELYREFLESPITVRTVDIETMFPQETNLPKKEYNTFVSNTEPQEWQVDDMFDESWLGSSKYNRVSEEERMAAAWKKNQARNEHEENMVRMIENGVPFGATDTMYEKAKASAQEWLKVQHERFPNV